eukprot:scaffold2102_cov161-Amphora_coffeaeformis.AAC.11
MVVIGSRSKASSSPFVILTSHKIWTLMCAVLVSLYPISLLLLWKATETTTPTTLRRVDDKRPPAVLSRPNDYADNNNGNDKPVIGYAVSITGCGSDPLTEGYVPYLHPSLSFKQQMIAHTIPQHAYNTELPS